MVAVGDSGVVAHIGEVQITVVSIEHLVIVGKCRVENVEMAVVLVVTDRDTHARGLAAVAVDGVA